MNCGIDCLIGLIHCNKWHSNSSSSLNTEGRWLVATIWLVVFAKAYSNWSRADIMVAQVSDITERLKVCE